MVVDHIEENTERSHIPLTQFPPMVIHYKTAIQYHNQDIDVDTVKRQSNPSPVRIPPTACSRPHSLPSQQLPAVGSLLL